MSVAQTIHLHFNWFYIDLICAGASTILDYDKPGSSMVEVQCLLDNVGTSELVIDLIVNTKNDRVFEESILLGIALLQGGNTQIQVGEAIVQLNHLSHFSFCVYVTLLTSTCFYFHIQAVVFVLRE